MTVDYQTCLLASLDCKKRMTLRELINHVLNHGNFNKTVNYIRQVDQTIGDKPIDDVFHAYTNATRELLELPGDPKYIDHEIVVESVVENNEEFSKVTLHDGETTYAIDFMDWNELINLEIKDKISRELSEMLAHVLYEITWWGFTRESVNQQRKELEDVDKDDLIEFDLNELK